MGEITTSPVMPFPLFPGALCRFLLDGGGSSLSLSESLLGGLCVCFLLDGGSEIFPFVMADGGSLYLDYLNLPSFSYLVVIYHTC